MPKRKRVVYDGAALVARGWTTALIEKLLPSPEKKLRGAAGNLQEIESWNISDIKAAEKTAEFLQVQADRLAEKYRKQYRSLKKEFAKAETKERKLAHITDLHRRVTDVLKKADVKSNGELCPLFEELAGLAEEIYVKEFNALYGYNIDPKDLKRLRYYKKAKTLPDKAFDCVINETIPSHPKDEYYHARQTEREFIIHYGPTNSGKTYHALEALKKAEKGIYLAPLRLLALEVSQKLNEDGCPCSLETGEEEHIVSGAAHKASTIEMLSVEEYYDACVIDEAQMIADPHRGSAWTRAVLGVWAGVIHVCCSSDALEILKRLIESCGDTFSLVRHERETPLVIEAGRFDFPRDVKKGDALISFSKKTVLAVASVLSDKGIRASVIYGDLPPESRRRQVGMFLAGETNVVVATDAIGMGLNLPIARIVFMQTRKYDGRMVRELNEIDVKQISGRAGRKNIYDIGFVNSYSEKHIIKKGLNEPLTPINKAYYLPNQKYILEMRIGTLEERLKKSMIKSGLPKEFYPSDIEQPLRLLSRINQIQNISMEELYRLIFIPFDMDNQALLGQWTRYVRSYVKKEEISSPPVALSDDLLSQETLYKSLCLYYSFCRSMGIPFDSEKNQNEKEEVAENIHQILKSRMQYFKRKCKSCGGAMPWNHEYGICEKCYRSVFTPDKKGF